MAMQLQLPDSKYATPEARRMFYEQVEPRLAAISGVEAVAVTTAVPPFGSGNRVLELEGRQPPSPGGPSWGATVVTISTRFFDVIGVPIARGRMFRATDGAPGSEAAIVNERLAATLFPGEDPIGKRLRFSQLQPGPGRPQDAWRTIVGISRSIPHGQKQQYEPGPVVYLPSRQDPPLGASLLVGAVAPASVMESWRAVCSRSTAISRRCGSNSRPDAAQDRWPSPVRGPFAISRSSASGLSSVGPTPSWPYR